MRPAFSEPAQNDPTCEIRLGVASWDDGSGTAQSVKYTWFDKNGKAARGGEFPVEALPQALDFAIRKGYVSLSPEEDASIPERVSSFLRQNDGVPYCDDCIQKNLFLKRRQQAHRVTSALAQTREFIREKGICSDCGGDKLVTRSYSK
jgi:hypothetical protein